MILAYDIKTVTAGTSDATDPPARPTAYTDWQGGLTKWSTYPSYPIASGSSSASGPLREVVIGEDNGHYASASKSNRMVVKLVVHNPAGEGFVIPELPVGSIVAVTMFFAAFAAIAVFAVYKRRSSIPNTGVTSVKI
jgi:hypothetical protein